MPSSRRTGCPARCGSSPSAASSRSSASSSASWRRCATLRSSSGPAGGQGIQHRLDRGGAPGGQVPIEAAGTFERGRQPQPAVLEPVRVTVGLGVRAEQLPRNPGQVTQRGAGSGGAEQLAVRLVADSGGEPVGPVRDLPAPTTPR